MNTFIGKNQAVQVVMRVSKTEYSEAFKLLQDGLISQTVSSHQHCPFKQTLQQCHLRPEAFPEVRGDCVVKFEVLCRTLWRLFVQTVLGKNM